MSAFRAVDRGASPTESLVSVASQLPAPTSAARQGTSGRATNGTSTAKRARGQAAPAVDDPATRADFVNPPSTSHPSLLASYSNTRTTNNIHSIVNDWPAGQLEGPGMPVARSFPTTPVAVPDPENDTVSVPAEADAEGDDTPYCFCHRASFGEMIACDGVGCAVEWVSTLSLTANYMLILVVSQYHLECVGLSKVPTGEWFCEDCRKKTTSKRGGRGGKRRAGGGRAAARNAAS